LLGIPYFLKYNADKIAKTTCVATLTVTIGGLVKKKPYVDTIATTAAM
jgi:hypothetical protein